MARWYGFTPRADVEETDDAYVIEVEVPGVAKKDIDVSVAGRRLTITGERKERERVGILRRRTRRRRRVRVRHPVARRRRRQGCRRRTGRRRVDRPGPEGDHRASRRRIEIK